MRILFLLVPVMLLFLACEKDTEMTIVDIYPIHFEYEEINIDSRALAEVLDAGDYQIIDEGDYGSNWSWMLDKSSDLFDFLEEEIGSSLVVDDIYFLSDTRMRIVSEFENEKYDTTVMYQMLNGGYLLNEGDTLPFTFDGQDLDFCAKVEVIFADPQRVPDSGYSLDNCFFNTSDPEMRIQELISDKSLIKGDTVAVALFELEYQRN